MAIHVFEFLKNCLKPTRNTKFQKKNWEVPAVISMSQGVSLAQFSAESLIDSSKILPLIDSKNASSKITIHLFKLGNRQFRNGSMFEEFTKGGSVR